MDTLRHYIDELRALPQSVPKRRIESLSHGLASISSGFLHGPFPGESAYNDWRISNFSSFGNQHPSNCCTLTRTAFTDFG
jgi:hypothetical protein